MSTCYVCGVEISKDNWTLEHILLNSIGGRLKSRDLICRDCNSSFGHEIDNILAEQLKIFANQLYISREDGEEPPHVYGTAKGGERISLDPGGKPIRVKPEINVDAGEKEVRVQIKARNVSEARKILNGLKRKYPNLDVEEVLKQAIPQSEYLREIVVLGMQFGGDEAFRSVTKSAINFFILHGGEPRWIEHLLPYITKGDQKNVVWFFYDHNEEFNGKSTEQVVHGLVLRGDPTERVLWCYVELFNAVRYVVLLNDDYDGSPMAEQYIFDVLQASDVELSTVLDIHRDEILQLVDSTPDCSQQMINQVAKLLTVITDKQRSDHQRVLLTRAIEKSLGTYPEGTIITEEMINELVTQTMNEITPWLLHMWSKPRED